MNSGLPSKSTVPWWQPALVVFGEVTGWIAVPVLLALFTGRALDEHYHSTPWFYLGCTAVAIAITCIGIVRVAGRYIREIEAAGKLKVRGTPKNNNEPTTTDSSTSHR